MEKLRDGQGEFLKLKCTYNIATMVHKDMPSRLTLGKEYLAEPIKGTHEVIVTDDLGELLIVNLVRFNGTGKRWTEHSTSTRKRT